jgi:hypothetical protein
MSSGLHVKWPLILTDFNETWIFLTDFGKILKCQISRKSIHRSRVVPWEQAGGLSVKTELVVAFRNFANAPKRGWILISIETNGINLSAAMFLGNGKLFRVSLLFRTFLHTHFRLHLITLSDTHTHTHIHTQTRLETSGRGIGPSHRTLPGNTQHSQEKYIHIPGGIRPRGPSKPSASFPRLRPRGSYIIPAYLKMYLKREISCAQN